MASLTLDWLHVIVLLGAIQGVFLAGALASKRRNRTANRLLGAAFPLPFLFGPLEQRPRRLVAANLWDSGRGIARSLTTRSSQHTILLARRFPRLDGPRDVRGPRPTI
jgi:hypothetical protein